MQAAIGSAQIKKLDHFIERRKGNHRRLYEILTPYADRLILPSCLPGSDPSWFGFVITVRENAGFNRNDLIRYLEANRIETRNLFGGNLMRHPAFIDIPHRQVGELRNTDFITTNTFFIGVYPGIDTPQLTWIEDVFKRFMQGERV
jgi:CDP-6-deoxy-D-xylo-4-hexulose-3-dehydrase